MECRAARLLMHEYLDGELRQAGMIELRAHLTDCPDCRALFKKMEGVESIIRLPDRCSSPKDMTGRIMAQLPEPRRRNALGAWLKRHPVAVIAWGLCMILLLNVASLFYLDRDMVVQGALDQLIFEGDTVIVPDGVTVNGDLKIKRAKLQVNGHVEGNVTIIDGSYQLASTAYISGHVTVIDRMLEWAWFKLKRLFISYPKYDQQEDLQQLVCRGGAPFFFAFI